MSKKIGEIPFAQDHQRIFLIDLKEGKIGHAESILESIPKGLNHKEELDRILIISQGYRLLLDHNKKHFTSSVAKYASLGTPLEISVVKQKLKLYEQLGTIDDIRHKLESLNHFTESTKEVL